MTQTAEHREVGRRSDKRSTRADKTAGEGETNTPVAGGEVNRRQVRSAGARGREGVVVGAEPRVHLLPPEVLADRKLATLRSRLGLGVLAAIAVIAVGTVGAGLLAMSAQTNLASEQAATQNLLKQQLTYVKVRSVQDRVDLAKTAQRVGASTEIAWMPYLQKVQDTLPPNVAITGVAVDSSTPIELYPQSTASLQGPRVATIVFTAQSPSLPEVPSLLTSLTALPGYADALPGSVTLDQSGIYTVTITMHVNDRAFAKRFTEKTGN